MSTGDPPRWTWQLPQQYRSRVVVPSMFQSSNGSDGEDYSWVEVWHDDVGLDAQGEACWHYRDHSEETWCGDEDCGEGHWSTIASMMERSWRLTDGTWLFWFDRSSHGGMAAETGYELRRPSPDGWAKLETPAITPASA
jgi:hypothetical protein